MGADRARKALIFLLVAGVVVAVFAPSFSAGWVAWDDDKNFLANPNFRGLGSEQLRWMWTAFHLGIWIPLSWMTLGANYLMFGMEPAGYHATNVALHAINAVLLTQLGVDVLARPSESGRADVAARAPWSLYIAAATGALFFALHPLRVESVTWITERRDVLSGMFYLATLLAFMRFADGGAIRWYVSALVLFLLALLAKGTAVTMPGAIALLWWYPLGRIGGAGGWTRERFMRAVRVIAPFGVIAVLFAVVVLRGLDYPQQLPLMGKLAVSAYSWCFYLAKTVWPSGLSSLYQMPEPLDPTAGRYLVAAGIIAVLALLGWRMHKRYPAPVMALLGFSVIVFPLLGLHQGGPQIAADRNTYNASFALALLVGGVVLAAWSRVRVVAPAITAVLVTLLAVVTWQQQRYWQNSEALWLRVLEVEPDNPHGHNNYGNALMADGRIEEALERYASAVSIRPTFAPALANLGVALNQMGRTDEAVTMLTRALAADSMRDDAEANLGAALARAGQLDQAMLHFARAIRINPQNADAEVNWGNALVRRGDTEGAIAHYQRAVAIRPSNADAHLNWGVALAQRGALPDAAEQFRRALALDPNNTAAQQYLAQVEQDLARTRR